MTKSEQIIEFAKLDGWTKIVELYEDNQGPSFWSGIPSEAFIEANLEGNSALNAEEWGMQLVDYFENYNEVIRIIQNTFRTENEMIDYVNCLISLMRGKRAVNASIEKRIEAALRQLGKWKD